MVDADLARAVLAGLLAVVNGSVGVAYFVAFGLATGALLFNPASTSLIPDTVDEDELVDANTAMWTVAVVAQIILAPTAGLLISAFGVEVAFAVNAASYLASAALLHRLPVGDKPATTERAAGHRDGDGGPPRRVTTSPRDHWHAVWRDRPPESLSWHQHHAERSLALITERVTADAAIIDVGGGDSPLAGDLVRHGYCDVTVLDIADAALAQGQHRLGPLAEQVHWIAADVATYQPTRRYQLWHDRAVFHFLTAPTDQQCYARTAAAAVPPGGWLLVAGFAPDGPEQCSGLPVRRHTNESLTEVLAAAFTPIAFTSERHVTPTGGAQSFHYATLRRR